MKRKVKRTMNKEIIFDIKVFDSINYGYEKKLERWHINGLKELEKWYKIIKKRHG